MDLHKLTPAKGAVKSGKRIARGQGSGRGGTSTKGHKGQKSRSGWSKKKNFEGGQMPIQIRLPKRGFTNPNRYAYTALNLGRIQEIHDKHGLTEITLDALVAKGIANKSDKLKVLANGELKAKMTLNVHAISETAKKAIESNGGTVNLV